MDIQVQRMYRFETDRPLKAFADIVIDNALLIKGVRVMDGKKGLFVSMPREQAKDKKWYDTTRCLTEEIRDQLTDVVLSAYHDEPSGNRTCDKVQEAVPNFDEEIKRNVNDIV